MSTNLVESLNSLLQNILEPSYEPEIDYATLIKNLNRDLEKAVPIYLKEKYGEEKGFETLLDSKVDQLKEKKYDSDEELQLGIRTPNETIPNQNRNYSTTIHPKDIGSSNDKDYESDNNLTSGSEFQLRLDDSSSDDTDYFAELKRRRLRKRKSKKRLYLSESDDDEPVTGIRKNLRRNARKSKGAYTDFEDFTDDDHLSIKKKKKLSASKIARKESNPKPNIAINAISDSTSSCNKENLYCSLCDTKFSNKLSWKCPHTEET